MLHIRPPRRHSQHVRIFPTLASRFYSRVEKISIMCLEPACLTSGLLQIACHAGATSGVQRDRNHWVPYCQQEMWLIWAPRLGDYRPLSSHRGISIFCTPWERPGRQAICNRRRLEATCQLLDTEAWHWFLQRRDTRLGVMAPRWLHGDLMCTICYPCVVHPCYQSHIKILAVKEFVTLYLWTTFVPIQWRDCAVLKLVS